MIGAFKLNPYEVLELNWMPSATVTEADIRAPTLLSVPASRDWGD